MKSNSLTAVIRESFIDGKAEDLYDVWQRRFISGCVVMAPEVADQHAKSSGHFISIYTSVYSPASVACQS